MGHGSGLPESLPPDYETNDEFLKAAHHAMLEVCNLFLKNVPCFSMQTPSLLYPDHLEGSGYDSHTRALTLTICWQVEVVEGELECPESGRKFPISEGIPNMLLREDEV